MAKVFQPFSDLSLGWLLRSCLIFGPFQPRLLIDELLIKKRVYMAAFVRIRNSNLALDCIGSARIRSKLIFCTHAMNLQYLSQQQQDNKDIHSFTPAGAA